ncbi:hypothetical protein SLS55_007088 [Diplodia seriata]|uniref:Uncharacterized protein n=1 Tax=Diplodia seriata TaxID=420778 RepID=A0ABR3CBC8_9PEZI
MSTSPEPKDERGSPGAGSSPSTIFFDPQGDTRLLVKVDEVDKVLVVCARVMCLVCDAWKCLLSPDGSFKEAQPTADGMREVDLPEDDGNALAILLNITHLRFDERQLPFLNCWLALSVLTDKYGATKLVTALGQEVD